MEIRDPQGGGIQEMIIRYEEIVIKGSGGENYLGGEREKGAGEEQDFSRD